MRWTREADDLANMMFFRHVFENPRGENIEIGVFPVMFGYRVRIGYVGSGFLEVDWCAGPGQENVERLYSLAFARLERAPFFDHNDWPGTTAVKPIFNDELWSLLVAEVGDHQYISIPPVETYKQLSWIGREIQDRGG